MDTTSSPAPEKKSTPQKKTRRPFGGSATLARRRFSNDNKKFEARTGQHINAATAASHTKRAIERGGRTAAERLLGAARQQRDEAEEKSRKIKQELRSQHEEKQKLAKKHQQLCRTTGSPNNPEVEGEEGSIRCLEDELQLERFRITRLERRVAVLQPRVDHLKKANATAKKKVCMCCGLGVVFFSASLSLLYDICTCFFSYSLSLVYIYLLSVFCVRYSCYS